MQSAVAESSTVRVMAGQAVSLEERRAASSAAACPARARVQTASLMSSTADSPTAPRCASPFSARSFTLAEMPAIRALVTSSIVRSCDFPREPLEQWCEALGLEDGGEARAGLGELGEIAGVEVFRGRLLELAGVGGRQGFQVVAVRGAAAEHGGVRHEGLTKLEPVFPGPVRELLERGDSGIGVGDPIGNQYAAELWELESIQGASDLGEVRER